MASFEEGDVFLDSSLCEAEFFEDVLVLRRCPRGFGAHYLLGRGEAVRAKSVGVVEVLKHDGVEFVQNDSWKIASAALFCDSAVERGEFEFYASSDAPSDDVDARPLVYETSFAHSPSSSSSQVCLAIHASHDRAHDALRSINDFQSDLVSLAIYGKQEVSQRLHSVTRVEPVDEFDYPINLMRNLAMDGCPRDSWVLLTDADLSLSSSEDLDVALSSRLPSNALFIVPAFESEQSLKPKSKASLLRFLDARKVDVFKSRSSPKSYRLDLNEWRQATAPYLVEYTDLLEPFVVFPPHFDERFDERFRGFGGNKMSFFLKNAHDLYVLPNVWLMHRKHSQSRYSLEFEGVARAKTRLLLMSIQAFNVRTPRAAP